MHFNEFSVRELIQRALQEDAAHKDITTLDFVSDKTHVQARILAKEAGVVCGVDMAQLVFKIFDSRLKIQKKKKDGSRIKKNDVLLTIKGRARSVLSCERVALNFLGYLSGIASLTREAVDAVSAKGVKILDTRKTTPLLRSLEKYAVSRGGGRNHRFDLAQQYLVKDNHLVILKKTCGMEVLARRKSKVPFEIEVENTGELKKALSLNPDIIMLDNFSPNQVRRALVVLSGLYAKSSRPLIELSGGITLQNISRYAIQGVDFISLGALTHSAPSLDVTLEITKVI